jgi:hypothetical protein
MACLDGFSFKCLITKCSPQSVKSCKHCMMRPRHESSGWGHCIFAERKYQGLVLLADQCERVGMLVALASEVCGDMASV